MNRCGLATVLVVAALVLDANLVAAAPPASAASSSEVEEAKSLHTRAAELSAKGDYAAAEPLFKKAIALREKALGADHPSTALSIDGLAAVYRLKGDYVAAEPLYRRSLAIFEKARGKDHLDVAISANDLALLLTLKGDPEQAEPLYRRALAILEKTRGPEHPDVATAQRNLGALLRDKGDLAAAEPLLRRSVAIFEKTKGKDHIEVATSLEHLARLLRDKHDHAGAELALKRLLAIREKIKGADHVDVAFTLELLAVVLHENKEHARAEPLVRRALAIREKVHGIEHHITAEVSEQLADILWAKGDQRGAETFLRAQFARFEQKVGKGKPDVAIRRNGLASFLMRHGDREDAEKLFQQSALELIKAKPPQPEAIAATFYALATLREAAGDIGGANSYFDKSLDIWEHTLGKTPAESATALDALAAELGGKGSKEERILRRSLALRERALGREHADVATSLEKLAAVRERADDWAEAEKLLRRALPIREKAHGPNDPKVAQTARSLSLVLEHRGDLEGAERYLRQELAIDEKTTEDEQATVFVVNRLHHLGELLEKRGNYAGAEEPLRRGLAMAEKKFGEKHFLVVNSLTALGNMLSAKGDYAAAEALHRRALAIDEKIFGPDDREVALDLNGLARILRDKGDYDGAEELERRVLAISEKQFSPDDPEVALALAGVANVLGDKRQYDEAEKLYRRALAIETKAFGESAFELGPTLHNLGVLLGSKGDYDAAEALCKRAYAIREKALGADHPSHHASLSILSSLALAKGNVDESEKLRRRALVLAERSFGPEHQSVALVLRGLAQVLRVKGDHAGAQPLLARAVTITDGIAQRLLQTGSSRQKQAYFATLRSQTDEVLASHLVSQPKSEEALGLALRTVLRRKGIAAEASAAGLQALASRAEGADRSKLDALAAARTELAERTLRGPTNEKERKEHATQLATLAKKVDDLENELASRHAELRIDRSAVTVESVQRSIPEGSALVEYVEYRSADPKSILGGGEPRFAAYVLPHRGKPSFVDLGPAKPIEAAVTVFRDALAQAQPAFVAPARALDALVVAPVRALLGDVRDVYVAPDGALSLVPFAALVDERNHFLVERYRFNVLTSGRDLARFAEPVAKTEAPIVIGGPNYGPAAAPQANNDGSRGARSVDFAKVRFPALPGALTEARSVGGLLPGASVLTEDAATEKALKQVRAPKVLHIATHGFFLDEPRTGGATGNRGLELSVEEESKARVSLAEDPMLRAGLAFAGANARASGDEDGILTALEATNLDLRGTQLVVLSACETGLGKATTGDGVYGLRRALVLSGSETQVMSLWKVDDEATRDLMADYYRRVLSGAGRSDALRETQIAMLTNKKTQHPYFWAAFVAAGDTRTLAHTAPAPVRVVNGPPADAALTAAKVRPPSGCGCDTPGLAARARWDVVLVSLASAIAVARRARMKRSL